MSKSSTVYDRAEQIVAQLAGTVLSLYGLLVAHNLLAPLFIA